MHPLTPAARTLAFSTATTLGGMIRERALGPQGEDVRVLYASRAVPGFAPPVGEDQSLHDVEHAASGVPGVRVGCCAAFGVLTRTTEGVEDLVLICETTLEDRAARATLAREVRVRVLEALNIAPDAVLLVEPGTVLKTSSGKIHQARVLAGAVLDRARRALAASRAS